MSTNKFNPCRFCGGNEQRFSYNEYDWTGKKERTITDVAVACKCGNATTVYVDSLDDALAQWNEQNPTIGVEPKEVK